MTKPSYHFGQFTPEHLILLREGVELFNSGHFWQCHEEVEDLWMDHIGDNARYVFWVIIQVATALYHLEDGNLNGACGMNNKAKKKLQFCEDNHVESELLEKALNWSRLKSLVREIDHSPKLEDFNKLAKFRFPSPESWKI